jgi:hypothetical protein
VTRSVTKTPWEVLRCIMNGLSAELMAAGTVDTASRRSAQLVPRTSRQPYATTPATLTGPWQRSWLAEELLCRDVCHEHGRSFAWKRSCLRWCRSGDEGWPCGVALREEATNRLVLRWLKTVVVSDRAKGAARGVRWVCHERWCLGCVGGSRGWRCCAVDEGLALRSRPAGGGFKPPHAAPVECRAW